MNFSLKNLQYKMFLLNEKTEVENWEQLDYLQYKMFLLNCNTQYK